MKTITKINSKKYLSIILFLMTYCVSFAQENSISPLFALSFSNSAFQNDLCAFNQVSGKKTTIESFASTSYLGNNFTVNTQATSNVDKLYILENTNKLAVYHLPYFFDPNYSGEQTALVLDSNITDLEYHTSSSFLYAFYLGNSNLYKLNASSAQVISTTNIPFVSAAEHFSLKTNNDFVVLCGQENDSTKLIFHQVATQQNQSLTLNTLYSSFKLIGHAEFDDFFAVAQDLNKVNWLLKINPSTLDVQSISTLPSCSNCAIENYNFHQNALALDWEHDDLLAILEVENNGNSNYSLLSIALADGNLKHVAPLENETNNLYFNKAASDLVFPGDANHDGVVNVRDLLPIGLRYSYNTTARFTQSIEWVGQHSFNTGVKAQGADIKHADCNGDGQINEQDVDAIKANYSSVHNSNKSASASNGDCDYPLAFSFINPAYQNNDATINVKLGEVFDPVDDVYGVSFTVVYNKSFVVANTMHTVGLNSWFGVDGNNCIHTSQDDYLNGKIDVSLTGVDLLNRSGGGDIIQIAWTMEDDLIPIAQQIEEMNLRIENPYIINLNEDVLESCGIDTVLQVARKNTSVGIPTLAKDKFQIYPNPAKDILNLKTDLNITQVSMYTIDGAELMRFSTNTKTINVSSLSKGIYLLKVEAKEGNFYQKVLID